MRVHHNDEEEQQQQRQPSTFTVVSCCKLVIFIDIMILISITWYPIYWFWLGTEPQHPKFHVTSLSLTNFHVSPIYQNITAHWNAQFQVKNPSERYKLFVRGINTMISCYGNMLTWTQLQPFQQDPNNVTFLDVDFLLNDSSVSGLAMYMSGQDMARGKMVFKLEVEAEIQYKSGRIRTFWWFLRVSCKNLEVGLSRSGESGNLIGGAKKCGSSVSGI